jgi:hypothetical protein
VSGEEVGTRARLRERERERKHTETRLDDDALSTSDEAAQMQEVVPTGACVGRHENEGPKRAKKHARYCNASMPHRSQRNVRKSVRQMSVTRLWV